MQQVGPSAISCLQLAQKIIEDFIIYQKSCCDQLKSLPMVAPRYVLCVTFVEYFFKHKNEIFSDLLLIS